MKKKNSRAFTLAEVLITLTIIGVVAAITVPVLNQSSQDKELNAQLKKSYSTLKQALNLNYAESGQKILRSDTANARTSLFPVLQRYIISLKDCGFRGEGGADCIKDADKPNVYKTFNGKSGILSTYFDDGQFIVPDGAYIFLEHNGIISVDINGANKKPNRLGKDLFMFQIDENGELIPMGAPGTTFYDENDSYCSNTSSNNMNGAGCTYKELQK